MDPHLVLGAMSAAIASLIGVIWHQIEKKLDRLLEGQDTHGRTLAVVETKVEAHADRLDVLEQHDRTNGVHPRGAA